MDAWMMDHHHRNPQVKTIYLPSEGTVRGWMFSLTTPRPVSGQCSSASSASQPAVSHYSFNDWPASDHTQRHAALLQIRQQRPIDPGRKQTKKHGDSPLVQNGTTGPFALDAVPLTLAYPCDEAAQGQSSPAQSIPTTFDRFRSLATRCHRHCLGAHLAQAQAQASAAPILVLPSAQCLVSPWTPTLDDPVLSRRQGSISVASPHPITQ
ncbi:hypothetical protein CKAH01_02539 [Colletotrichum kahawae]|uniref:Uncharacterized protein n=1 Tax=Colletotrichum kahawae TaxID=34407 RepID=A0AAD9XY47_COLKA|nr:hypothetical protein CKAH01_02539 [Colletotrichum kahawae]